MALRKPVEVQDATFSIRLYLHELLAAKKAAKKAKKPFSVWVREALEAHGKNGK
jgi:hypothetical protein